MPGRTWITYGKRLVKQKQKTFFQKMLQERSELWDDPFLFSIELAKENDTTLYSYIKDLVESQVQLVEGSVQELKENSRSSERSKFKTYREINQKWKNQIFITWTYQCT